MRLGKRANWVDVFEYGRGILILGISIIIGFILVSSFNSLFIEQASHGGVLNDSSALTYSQRVVDYFNVWDYVIPLIFVFFLGFSAWSASKIDSSHKFLFLIVIMLIVTVMFGLFIELLWDAFTTSSVIASYVNSFPLTNIFLSYLRYFVLIYDLIVGVALYAKPQ